MATKQRNELAARTALLYYEYQKGQNEIALELGISRSYVSQLLTYARESGVVKISINVGAEYLKETEFAARFPNLRHAYIMQSESAEYTAASIGRFAAPHISRLINAADAIGINLGLAVQSLIECLDESEFTSLRSRTVAQIMGGFSTGHNDKLTPGELVTRLAQKIGAQSLYLNCPVIVDNPQLKHILVQENSIASLFAFWKRLDLAIMGIGALDEKSRIYAKLPEPMRRILADNQACCEITANFYNEQGMYLPLLLDNKIAIPNEDLLAVKTKAVIGHGKHKARAILAGLRAGMINVLVTDSLTITEIEAIVAKEKESK